MNLIERRRQMMTSEEHGSGTLEIYPSGYDNNDKSGYFSGINNGYAPYTSSTICIMNGAEEIHIYYTFNLSELPANATIISADMKAKALVNNMTTAALDVCKNKQSIASESIIGVSTYRTFDLSSWTAADLQNLSLKVHGTITNPTSAKRILFYGATLTINYEY